MAAEITAMIDFEIEEDHIAVPGGQLVYFFRLIPPNLSVLNDSEKEQKINAYASFLDSNEYPVQVFALDKTEDLSFNKEFYQNLNDSFDAISGTIVREIEKMQGDNQGIQRAYYLIFRAKRASERETISDLIANMDLDFYIAQKHELITVVRNFFSKDFADFSIFDFNQEVQKLYDSQKYN